MQLAQWTVWFDAFEKSLPSLKREYPPQPESRAPAMVLCSDYHESISNIDGVLLGRGRKSTVLSFAW